MAKEKLYLDKEKFDQEIKDHKGATHPEKKYKGHYAKLDKQVDIAFIIGVSRPTLNNWIMNRQPITKDNLEALADLFGCDWEYLCGKQELRTKQDMIKKALDNIRKPADPNKPWFDYLDFDDRKLVTCSNYTVPELIVDIIKMGGYNLILDGLREVSGYIKIK